MGTGKCELQNMVEYDQRSYYILGWFARPRGQNLVSGK